MEETPVDEVKPASSGLTLGKGLALILGGALLGFFGCLGGLSLNSIGVAVLMLVSGVGVMVWGGIMTVIVIWRAMSR